MLKKIWILTAFSLISSSVWAKGGSYFGASAGLGFPYVSQFALNYIGTKFSADIRYGSFSVSSGLSEVSLSKPEVNLNWHPFSGALFLGVGVGQQTLTGKATDLTTGETAKVEVTSLTVTPSIGFLWGKANGGFFVGMDAGYQLPMSPEVEITSALPKTNQAYIDAEEQGKDLGEESLPLLTFLKLGWVF